MVGHVVLVHGIEVRALVGQQAARRKQFLFTAFAVASPTRARKTQAGDPLGRRVG